MAHSGITILGLGPGSAAQLTRRAWDWLGQCNEVYLRTCQHPTVTELPAGVKVHSFDALYEQGESFPAVYEQIVMAILDLGRRPQGVTYAVPGHPFVAEATSPEIVRRARQEGLPVQVIDGLSFLEPVFTAVGVDPYPHTALVDAMTLSTAHHPPFPPHAPALIAQIYSQLIAAEVKMTLLAVYPDQHPVKLVHAAGTPQERVESLALYEIDRSPFLGLLSSLYLPPLPEGTALESFQEVVAHLRAPDGCPWDHEQTHLSLRANLLEETYEALEELDAGNPQGLCEELGDLLLQIVLNAQIASEAGEFNMADIIQGIYTKIIRRHPHVFGDVKVEDVSNVLQNWEKLKAAERQANGQAQLKGLLDGVPLSLPALAQALEISERAARVGFEWPDVAAVWDKVHEEFEEVRQAGDDESRAGELGDVLFATVNLIRWYKVDAESVLRQANTRFRRRFKIIEDAARIQDRPLTSLSYQEWDELWEMAKKRIRDEG